MKLEYAPSVTLRPAENGTVIGRLCVISRLITLKHGLPLKSALKMTDSDAPRYILLTQDVLQVRPHRLEQDSCFVVSYSGHLPAGFLTAVAHGTLSVSLISSPLKAN